jgi:hypothetical protein
MIQSVCTGFVVAKRPDGTRIVSAPDYRHDPIDAVPAAPPASGRNGRREWTDIAPGRQGVIRIT